MTDEAVVDVWHTRSYAAGPAATLAAHRECVRSLLADALGRRLADVELQRLPGGKPVLADGQAHLSVTHTGDHLLVAVTPAGQDGGTANGTAGAVGGPLGIDAERSRRLPDVDSVARLVLSPCERARLAALAPEHRQHAVLRAWTRKEALLKADGVGLVFGAGGLEVDLEDGAASGPGSVRPLVHSAGWPWHLYDLDVGGGLVAALATTGPARVRLHAKVGSSPHSVGGLR